MRSFLTRWVTIFVAWYAFGLITIEILRSLGTDLPTAQVLAYLLGLGLLAIALRIVWRPADVPPARRAGRLAWTALIVAVWLLWVLGAKPLMWTLIVVGVLPGIVRGLHRAVRHLFRPGGDAGAAGGIGAADQRHPASTAGLRFALYALAIALLVWGWGLDVGALAAQQSPGARLAQGFLHAIVILLVADLLWKLARTAIDRQLAAIRAGWPVEHGPRPVPRRRRAAGRGCARCCRSCASCCSSCWR